MKYLTRKFVLATVVAASVAVPVMASALIVLGPTYVRPAYTAYPAYVNRLAYVPPHLVTTTAIEPGHYTTVTDPVMVYNPVVYTQPLWNPLNPLNILNPFRPLYWY